MGIDVYMHWKGQTEKERKAQITGWSIEHGHVGYLREAYHGGPYATAALITEDLDTQPDEGFTIPAAELKRRLPATVMTAIYRDHVVYGEGNDPSIFNLDSKDGFEAFAKALAHALSKKEAFDIKPNEEQTRAVMALIEARKLPGYALSFVDFVQLAERKERETGEPVKIVVSA